MGKSTTQKAGRMPAPPVALKSGFTTGTAAAAATKAALTRIVTGYAPGSVDILLLTGNRMQIPIHCCKQISGCRASATVIKDAGDDPDVTHLAEIGAIVTLCSVSDFQESHDVEKGKVSLNITITGGEGVGHVTLPGLEIPPGEPAINLGPRKMIVQAIKDVLDEQQLNQVDKIDSVCVEVFAPQGKLLAEKTLNARLGIIGGISILGTTGIVRPMSHDAYIGTIASSLSVARAGGCMQVVLTTGRRSERFAQSAIPDLPEVAFIQIGDFFKTSLEAAIQKEFTQITIAVLFGKALKMAQGFAHTHAAKSDLSLAVLSEWAMDVTRDREFSQRLSRANTAREALSIITKTHPAMISDVGRRMLLSAKRFAGEKVTLQGIIFDYTGKVLYRRFMTNSSSRKDIGATDHAQVIVIGMGLSLNDLTARHLDIIRRADILIGGKRHLACFKDHPGIQKEITRDIPELTDFIGQHFKAHQIVVLASGDPLLFGIGSIIVDALGPDHVEIHPNISSVSAAFSRIKEPWQDARVVSMHGKTSECSLLDAVKESPLVAILTDPVRNPAWIAALLLRHKIDGWMSALLKQVDICVLEQLGMPSEKISWHSPEEVVGKSFSEPNIVVLKRTSVSPSFAGLHLGMPDDAYDHENGLITKPEIRAISLAKLKLQAHHVLWDLGAGSGSIGIEASLLMPQGIIVSIEKHPDRIRNIECNRLRHGVTNMDIRQAVLPDGLDGLLAPDRIFIGGGGKKLEAIIRSAARYLKPDGVIVLNTVLMDNLTTALTTLKELGFSTDTVQIQFSRSKDMPWSQRFEAQNPVWIISGIIKP